MIVARRQRRQRKATGWDPSFWAFEARNKVHGLWFTGGPDQSIERGQFRVANSGWRSCDLRAGPGRPGTEEHPGNKETLISLHPSVIRDAAYQAHPER